MKKEDLKTGYYICEGCIPLVKNQDGIDSIEDSFLIKKTEKAKNADSDLRKLVLRKLMMMKHLLRR